MSYYAMYKLDLDKEIETNICFTAFYKNPKKFQNICIYALEDYRMYKNTNELAFTSIQIKEYLNSFLKMGFVFSYSYKKELKTPLGIKGGWEMSIPTKDNSDISIKILTNIFRYLYEKSYKNIVEYYLQLKNDRRKDVSNWNKFMMAHYSYEYWDAHSIYYPRSEYIEMLSDSQFKDAIINNTNKVYTTESLPSSHRNLSSVEFKQIIEDFEKNILNVYSYFDYSKIAVKLKTINNKNESLFNRRDAIQRLSKLVTKISTSKNSGGS